MEDVGAVRVPAFLPVLLTPVDAPIRFGPEPVEGQRYTQQHTADDHIGSHAGIHRLCPLSGADRPFQVKESCLQPVELTASDRPVAIPNLFENSGDLLKRLKERLPAHLAQIGAIGLVALPADPLSFDQCLDHRQIVQADGQRKILPPDRLLNVGVDLCLPQMVFDVLEGDIVPLFL